MKFNAISQEFPLINQFGNISPEKPKIFKSTLRVFPEIKNGYNNEAPTLFRIDSMKENKQSYTNRYLGEIVDENRSSFLKNYENNKEQIETLDKIKSDKGLSQEPESYSGYINGKRYNDLREKRNNKNLRNSYEPTEKFNKEVLEKVKSYSPKLSYKLRNSLNLPHTENFELRQRDINFRNSTYLRNYQDFSIKENMNEKEDNYAHHQRKDYKQYNCILDTVETKKQEQIKNRRWDSFYENYHLILNRDKSFKRKGGLFTELFNKAYIHLNKKSSKNVGEKKSPVKTPKMKVNFMKSNAKKTSSPTLDRAKKVIDDNGLYKLKDYLMKSGAIKD